MKKLFLLLAGAFVVLQTAMASHIYGYGFCDPSAAEFQIDQRNDYISLYDTQVFKGQSATVTATPSKGWAVDSWWVQLNGTAYYFDVTKIEGSEGKLTCTRACPADPSKDNEYLSVKFRWLTYNLAYDSNGGASVPGKNGLFYTNEFALAAAPVRAGYDFAGWKDKIGTIHNAGASVSGVSFKELDDVHADASVTLTAQWNAQTYTVKFDANGGGSPSPASKTVTYDSTYGDLATCSRTGYDFDGWYTGKTDGTKIESGTKVAITANQTLYAHWTAKTYSVTVDPNGGTGGKCPDYKVSSAQQKITLTSPTRTGYSISKWTVTGATGGTPTVAGTTLSIPANVSGNLTLTPSWSPISYSITYTGHKAAHSNPSTYTIESETIVFTPPEDVVGFKFNGWSPVSIAKGSTGNKTVTASYLTKIDHPVAETPLTYNGSVQSCASSTAQYQATGNQQTVPGQYTATFTLFDGYCWSDGNTGSYSVPWKIQNANLADVSVGQSGSLTYTGKEQTPVVNAQARAQGEQPITWEYSASGSAFSTAVPSFRDAGTYTVYYRANAQYHNQASGTFTVTIERAKTASVNVSPTQLPYTKKEQGPTVTVQNCTTRGDLRATDIGPYQIKAQPATNYAWSNGGTEERTFEWSIVDSSYTIKFDGAGASGPMEPVTLVRDEPYVVENGFTKKGCEFVTWRTVIGGVATNFDVGVTVSNLTSEVGAVLTFTADWLGRYTVAFDKNGGEGTMTNVTYEVDREYLLPSNAFTNAGYHFIGWSTNGTKVVFTNCAAVSNLAAPGETCTLVAQWKQISLAEAMHCENLIWTSEFVGGDMSGEPWLVAVGDNVGSNSSSCVRQEVTAGSAFPQALTAKLDSEGTLTFWWKPTGGRGELAIWCNNQLSPETPQQKEYKDIPGTNGVWSSYTLTVPSGAQYVHIMNLDLDASADIDRMTWTPKGKDPTPGEQVRVSATAVENGAFKLSVAAASGSDYGVWTNADLTVDSWGLMGEPQAGEDETTLDFSWTILPEMPRLFFRAHKVDYK